GIQGKRLVVPSLGLGWFAGGAKQVSEPRVQEGLARACLDQLKQMLLPLSGCLDKSAIEQSTTARTKSLEITLNLGAQREAPQSPTVIHLPRPRTIALLAAEILAETVSYF